MQINKKIVFFSIIFSFLFNTISVFSQKTKKVTVKGISITRDLTPKEALDRAINEAKINALRKAGVIEKVSRSSFQLRKQQLGKNQIKFEEFSSSEIEADILIDSILKQKKWFDKYDNLHTEVVVSASIFKHDTSKDHSFIFNVKGLKEVYYESETVSFQFDPNGDGYLKIFVINENEIFQLYPYIDNENDFLSDNPKFLFIQDKSYQFPLHQAYSLGYSIELKDTNDELTKLIFVYTKNHYKSPKKLDLKSIWKWAYTIPVNKRYIKVFNILQKKNK